MKVAKIKKTNNNKKDNKVVEESYSIKKFIIILLVLSVIFVVFYFITYLVVKDKTQNKDTSNNEKLDSSEILLKDMLNMEENEYFVLAIKSEESLIGYSSVNYSSLYEKYIQTYNEKDETLKFYYIDLNNSLNNHFSLSSEESLTELSDDLLKDDVLFKVKNSKIEFYKSGNEEIIDFLSKL